MGVIGEGRQPLAEKSENPKVQRRHRCVEREWVLGRVGPVFDSDSGFVPYVPCGYFLRLSEPVSFAVKWGGHIHSLEML